MSKEKTPVRTGREIAVIGMAGRFPGADNINTFWANLKNGIESITRFTYEELIAAGVDPQLISDPDYVKASGALQGTEYFDSYFFGYSPEEAMLMNPQIRIFHECAWEALEDAGYNPDNYKGLIGLYAGSSSSVEWEALNYFSKRSVNFGQFAANSLADKDYLCSRVSYKLNLKGPAYTINTACSTSLVSIHLASRALLTGECSMALAGGISIMNRQTNGYLYQEGMVLSPDGHCRAFDHKSMGTVPGNGAGIVVLKLLKNAITDRDHIYAVIKGSAINNDGARKVGFAAPSVDGQCDVIRIAQRIARTKSESISYIETHGTGTVLGDPVEIAAMKLAFDTDKEKYCAIGSVKTNVGHLDAAAGITGFIKTVLALKHKQIPPSLNFKIPNSRIDFVNSPFYVNTRLKKWENNMHPLRAGVNSFGIGGTNTHVVLEEMPQTEPAGQEKKWNLISLSAKTPEALERITNNFGQYLRKNPAVPIADAAYTLLTGRQHFKYRRMFVCSGTNDASAIISSESQKMQTFQLIEERKTVVFMFSGLGSQYINMGFDLYRDEPGFRSEIDKCLEVLNKISGIDIMSILYPPADLTTVEDKLADMNTAQIITFIFEYSLARLLMRWGVKPQAMIGYSFGEYTAACLAGIFSLEDALMIISCRGELIRETEAGAMLSVPLPEEDIAPHIGDHLSIAVSNGPSCVVAGPCQEIALFEKKMRRKRLICMPVNTTRAVHSKMMEPIMQRYEERITRIQLHPPRIPLISNVTGTWMAAGEAVDPGYWVKHLRNTVKFDDGIKQLLAEKHAVFIEVGPGRDLSLLLERHLQDRPESCSVNLIRPQNIQMDDRHYLLNKLGHLWLYGVKIDWMEFYSDEQRRRIPLPTYPFEKKFYKFQDEYLKAGIGIIEKEQENGKKQDIADWFYQPLWQQSTIPLQSFRENKLRESWLIFSNEHNFDKLLTQRLLRGSSRIVIIRSGEKFEKISQDTYTINPGQDEDYETLFTSLIQSGPVPGNILHLWSVCGDEAYVQDNQDTILTRGLHSLLAIARTAGNLEIQDSLRIKVVINNLHQIIGDEKINPLKATILGAVKIIPVEYMNITCSIVDICVPGAGRENTILEQLYREIAADTGDIVAAYRGSHRWIQFYKPVRISRMDSVNDRLKNGGVYLIAGGLGGMGYTIAGDLARNYNAKLVLTGRSFIPDKNEWDEWLQSHPAEDAVSLKILRLRELEQLGAEVLARVADVTDFNKMRQTVDAAIARFGTINGVIHAAGIIDFGGVIQKRTRKITEDYLASKVTGTLVLESVLSGINPDFIILFSSFSNMLYSWKFGQASYVAANEFLDAYSYYMNGNGKYTVTINWSDWQEVGMAITTINQHHKKNKNTINSERFNREYEQFLKESLKPSEGVEIFKRILNSPFTHLIISPRDFNIMLAQQSSLNREFSTYEDNVQEGSPEKLYPRPRLRNEYMPPENELEKKLQVIFQNFFGYEGIGVNDDFFDLGGDSLKAMSMISKIKRTFNILISLKKFFETPTVKGLAGILTHVEDTPYIAIRKAPEAEYYQPASLQKRLFVLNKLEESNMAYNMIRILLIDGELNKQLLDESFRLLIDRHEVLRTSFDFVDNDVVEFVHQTVDFKMDYLEPGTQHDNAASEKYIREIAMDFIRPFDLRKAPIFRAKLVMLNRNQYLLLFDLHHIIADGISMTLLERDLMALYHGEKLPRLEFQYKDFAGWQNNRYRTEEVKKQEKYWVDRFSGELPVLDMPLDFPRPPRQSFEGNSLDFSVGEEYVQKLNELATANNATLYMVLLAAYNVLLSRYTGQEDIIIGSPISCRQNEETENLIGLFINTLLMRNFPRHDLTFREFLQDVRKNSMEAYANQEYQFENLLKQLKPVADLSRNPLYDTMFTLHSPDDMEYDTKNWLIKGVPLENKASRFDFTMDIIERNGRLDCRLEYCTRLFKKQTMQRFSEHYRKILREIIDNPDKKPVEMDILSKAERAQLLQDFNDTYKKYEFDKTIHRLFEEQADKSPSAMAVKFDNQIITYRELNSRANRLARLLRMKGATSGSIIGIMVKRSVEMITGLLGILKVGAAYLPIDHAYPADRIQYMLNDSGAAMLLSQTAISRALEFRGNIIDIEDPATCRFEDTNLEDTCVPGDTAYIIYTSGSTGRPKGVLIDHKAVVNFIEGITYRIRFPEGKSILNLTTISFDIFVLETFLPLTKGLRVVIAGEEQQMNPLLINKMITQNHVHMLQITPSRLNLLVNDTSCLEAFKNIDVIMVGGETFPVNLLEKIKTISGARIYNMYGPTETTIWSSVSELTNKKKIDIGTPLLNTVIYIMNQHNMLQPIGVRGELCISGTGVAKGYHQRPDLTKEKFIADPIAAGKKIYRTGDAAKWLEDGNIEFLGRMDRQVKIRGHRIEPGEIESCLLKHQRIKEAIVIDRTDQTGNSFLCAYYVSDDKIPVTELRQWSILKLPDYMIPAYFLLLEKIPYTPNGKIDRSRLPSCNGFIKKRNGFAAPVTELEKKINAIWEDILGMQEIDINDNFFEIGGNSLLAIRLELDIEKAGFKINYYDLLIYNTIKKISEFLKSGKETPCCVKNVHTQNTGSQSSKDSTQIRMMFEKDGIVLQNIEPFNDIFYQSCFYNSLFPVLRYYQLSILPVLVNDVIFYSKGLTGETALETIFKSIEPVHKKLNNMGLYLESKNYVEDIISSIKASLSANQPVILWVDCYYTSIRGDTYNKMHLPHTWLIYGINEKMKTCYILEHKHQESLFYEKSQVSYSDVINSYAGYVRNYQETSRTAGFYQFTVDKNKNITFDAGKCRTRLIGNFLQNRQSLEEGLLHLKKWLEECAQIILDKTQLNENADRLIKNLSEIINAKRVEYYRNKELFSEQELPCKDLYDLIDKYMSVRSVIVKYTITLNHEHHSITNIDKALEKLYLLEREYYNNFHNSALSLNK